MKLTKKALSLLLAVLMIMTSVSVSFDSLDINLSFAASAKNGDGVADFVSAAIAHGQKYGFGSFSYSKTGNAGDSGVIYKTWTYTAGSYAEFTSYADVIAKMKTATFNLDEYTVCKTHNSNKYCYDAWEGTTQANKCTDWVHIKNALISAMGSDYATLVPLGIDTLFDATFNRKEIYVQTGDNDPGVCVPSGNKEDNGTTTSSGNLPAQMYNKIVINKPADVTAEVILAATSVDNIPSTVNNSYYLQLGLQRGSQYKSSSCTTTSGNKFHMHLYDESGKAPTSGPSYDGTTSIDKSALTTCKTTFDGNADFLAATDKNAVLAISNNETTIQNAMTALQTAKAGVINKHGQEIYNKFFGSYAYDRTITNLQNALIFLGFERIISTLDSLCATPIEGMTTTELAALLASINTTYDEYRTLSDADKADIAATYPDFDPADVDAKIKTIQDYYEVALVNEKKAVIDTHLAEFEGKWTMEDVDENNVDWPTANAAYLLVEQDYLTLKSMDKANIIAVCGEGYIERVEALYKHLAEIDLASNFNDQYTIKYREFYSTVQKNVPQTDTATLLSSLQTYDTWYAELRNIIEGMSAGLSEEVCEMLFDAAEKDMMNYMDTAYAVLDARVEAQINIAYELYAVHEAVYGPTVHFVSLESYLILKDSIGKIDTAAYNFLAATPNFNLDPEVTVKYNKLQAILPKYDEFAKDMGFETYYELKVADFESAEDSTNIFHTDKFTSNDAQIEKIITIIDAALTNESVANVIGLNLGEMLNDLVGNAILSDGFINTVVELLYPLVLKEFGKVFANDLPAEASGYTVNYKIGLYSVLNGSKFYLYPDQVASQIKSSSVAKNYKEYTKTTVDANGNTVASTVDRLTAAYNEYKNLYKVGADSKDAYRTDTDPAGGTDANGNPRKIIVETPWDSMQIRDAETGKINLYWGVDAKKESGASMDEVKAYFYEAFDDAMTGLKPLLLAIIANKAWNGPTVSGLAVAGPLDAAKVSLELDATANSGYANLLVPIFEALGVSYTAVSTVEGSYLNDTTKDVEQVIKAILDPIFALINDIGNAPLSTILGLLPNLCYALSAGMIEPLLSMLKTTITYLAPVSISSLLSSCAGDITNPSGGVDIDVGAMLDLKSMGVDLSGGLNGILAMLGLEGLPRFNQELVACLGELTIIDSQRKDAVYGSLDVVTGYENGDLNKPIYSYSGKAYNIVANKADVLAYLAEYLLTAIGQEGVLDMILGLFGGSEEAPAEGEEGETPVEPETPAEPEAPAEPDLLTTILTGISTNPKAALAAIIELFNFSEYEAQVLFTWFENGNYTANNIVGFDPATEIYLDPKNDWTEEKAEYLYANLETIINTVLAMTSKDAEGTDDEAIETVAEGEEAVVAAQTLGTLLAGLVDGLYTNKTLTSLATLLAKLDLNALLNKAEEPAEGEDAPEVVAEEDEEEKEPADYNALVKELLGIDLTAIAGQYADIAAAAEAAKEAGEEYVYDFGIEDGDAKAFIAKLVDMLDDLSLVLDFLLMGKNLTITLGETITFYGGKGYDYAIIPLLEALGCEVTAATTSAAALEAILTALVARINEIIANPVDEIFDILAGLVYFLTSNGISTVVLNLLKPALVVLETIKPIYNLDLGALIGSLVAGEGEEAIAVNLKTLDANFVLDLVSGLLGLNLTGLKGVLYDVAGYLTVVEYDSASTLQATFKTATYNEQFNQADVLTVILSYALEWVSVTDNQKALAKLLNADEMAVVNGLAKLFTEATPDYKTPNWSYWFDSANDFDAYITGGSATLETTLGALEYPNDWDDAAADYFANNLSALADMVVSMIEIDGVKYENLATLLAAKVNVFNAETLQSLVDLIAGLLEGIDDTLLDTAGMLLNVNITGLKSYKVPAIDSTDAFFAELANILTTYAKGLVDFLFFGKDYKFGAKADAEGNATDSLILNGGDGYAEGLALILEALGCKAPAADEATVANVFAAIADRIDAIFANPVDEVVALLPNLVYFLNANGLGVAVDNILAPVYTLLDVVNGFIAEPISIADLIKFEKKVVDAEGNEETVYVGLDLAALSLENILTFVEELTGLNLEKAEDILVGFCYGNIEKTTFGYKMVGNAKDTITILLTTVFALLSDKDFSATLAEMTGADVIANINTVFAYGVIEYADPNWNYCVDSTTGEVIESALKYPNNWNEEAADYIINNLPALVDTVIAMINTDENAPKTLGALLQNVLAESNIFTSETLASLFAMIKDIDLSAYERLLDAGVLLDIDVNGLLAYEVPAGINTVEGFAAELANILTTYAKGLVEWIFLGKDFKFFVTGDIDNMSDIIVLNGANGYAEGLALILEALGCKNLPVEGTTKEIVDGVFASIAARINEIVANPVEEVLALLPNILYFINANGLAAAVNNIAAAPLALVAKLNAFGVEIDINELINIEKIAGVEEDLAIGVDNLTLAAVIELVEAITGLDLDVLDSSLANFALGELQAYTSVSGKTAYKMAYTDEFGRHDMITVVLTSVFAAIFGTEGNAAKLDAMLETDLVTAIEDVFNPIELEYGKLDFKYPEFDGTEFPGNVINTNLTVYPTDWTEVKAEWLANNLPTLVDAIVGLIDIDGVKYESLGALLTANVNVFTAENLQAIVDMLAKVIGGIDAGLLEAAGLLLNVDVNGLAAHKVPADIATVDAFAAELANILNTYAKGLIEWLFLGEDYRFFVKDVDENGLPVSFVTIQGTEGYAEALALILEALGCENLPAADGTTEEIVNGIFASIAARINEIFASPVEEVIDLLPGLIYFLNANGAAVVVDNLTAGITALLKKLEVFGLNVDINELVNLQEILETEVEISLDNLTLATIIDVVGEKVGLDLTAVKTTFVDYALGEVVAYDSVSANEQFKMIYSEEADKGDMLTAVLVAVLLTAFETEGNADVLAEMLGAETIAAIELVINDGTVLYGAPEWDYCIDATTETVIESALEYPNDWNKEAVTYLTANLPALVDAVMAMINGEGATLAALLQDVLAEADIFTTETLQGLIDMIAELLGGIEEGLLEAGILVDVDINGLKKHKVTEGIATVDAFAAELALILNTYAKGLVEWLLLGVDFEFFFKNEDVSFITINGAHGYAKGLALLLEALGCKDLPAVNFEEDAVNDSEAIVNGVFASIAARINEILANPVGEILDLLPNVIYFLNANGVAVVVENLTAAITTLLAKLAAFGIKVDINELVNIEALCGIDKDLKISLKYLKLDAIFELVGELVGLDLTTLETVIGGFALGTVEEYTSVSGEPAYKMSFARHDMVTVILTAVIDVVFNNEANGAALAEMLDTDLLTAIEEVFNSIAIEYGTPVWGYASISNESIEAVKQQIQNPNNWTNEDSAYLAEQLPEAVDMIVRQLVEIPDGFKRDEFGLSEYLNIVLADANIFTSATIQKIVDALAVLLKDIDEGLVETAGLVLDIDVNGLKKHNVTEGIDTIDEFTAELALILNTYAKGLVEWLLLGRDFKFLVKEDKNYDTVVDFITINGAYGYAEGLALILEALGCENLPTTGTTEEIVNGVFASLAARINAIIADPVNAVIDLLPNLLYFINTNGLAIALNNTVAAINALLTKLAYLGIDLKLTDLVDLKAILGLPETALISLDKLDMEALLEVVEILVPELSIKHLKNILVNFSLGKLDDYTSVSGKTAYKMVYRDGEFDKGNMLTVVANAAIMILEDEDNFNFFFNLLGEKAMTVILSLFNFDDPLVKDFEWKYVNADGSYDANAIYSGFSASENYDKNAVYGDLYTKEMAEYIATNFPDFVDNMVYLIGVDVDGDGNNETTLTRLLEELLNGGLYNSANAIAIRDALYNVINNALKNIKVGEDFYIGTYIKMILKLSHIADIDAIAAVEITEFNNDKAAFVAAICDILEPIYPVLRFVLADENFRFFTTVDEDGKPTDAITIKGAEGYAYGIIPLLELLECNADDILTQGEYYEAIKNGKDDVMVTSILNPLLKRIEAILADPAGELLNMLPNIVYFINSNGLDTVVQNLLSAVFAILTAIEPIKKIDLYEAVYNATGLDVKHVDFESLVNFALGLLNNQGYTFTVEDVEALSDLAVGKLTHYTSKNGKTAYKMVYVDGVTGGKTEMVNIIEGLIITFITDEKNQKVVVDFLVDKLGMGEDGKKFAEGTIEVLAGALQTELGMQAALTAVYYIYYGLDVGADSTVGGLTDINKIWSESLESIKNNVPGMGDVIDDILDLDILDGIVDDTGLAPQGLAKFFTKIASFFQKIGDFFRNLFSFGK